MRKSICILSIVAGLLVPVLLLTALPVTAADLSQDEINDLVYLREEEKLARDVYDALGQQWGSQVFTRIESSEQTHMDAIKGLLDKYGIPDPAEGNGYGVFDNRDLQTLYDALVKRGSQSPVEAYRVGVLIEQTDITDLLAAISRTERVDIKTVYGNLLRGSQSHLKAFTSHLVAEGY